MVETWWMETMREDEQLFVYIGEEVQRRMKLGNEGSPNDISADS